MRLQPGFSIACLAHDAPAPSPLLSGRGSAQTAGTENLAQPVIRSGRGKVFTRALLSFSLMSSALVSNGRPGATNISIFHVEGVVRQLKNDQTSVIIQHSAISNFMESMTMPFKVKEPKELARLRPGDAVSFQLHVTEEESWIDHILQLRAASLSAANPSAVPTCVEPLPVASRHPLLDFKFTNELGQAVSLGDFQGQALAITFFFTRCPIPDYCPRLSKNFQEASRRLAALSAGPTNWHFLSVSFDPTFDSPSVLRAYAQHYHYDPAHWSFLTGPADKIAELARLSDVTFAAEAGFISHNFRTLIIDPAGDLQMTFPVGGDSSDALVDQIQKAVATTAASATPVVAREAHAR